jgi:hypothetical protein
LATPNLSGAVVGLNRKLHSDLVIGVVVLLFVSLHLFMLVLVFNRLYVLVVLALGASHKLRFFVRGNHVSLCPSDLRSDLGLARLQVLPVARRL